MLKLWSPVEHTFPRYDDNIELPQIPHRNIILADSLFKLFNHSRLQTIHIYYIFIDRFVI